MKKTAVKEVAPMPMLMTAKQMSAVSGIGENTLRKWMDEGELEYLPIGNHRLLRREAILEYYERHKTPARVGM